MDSLHSVELTFDEIDKLRSLTYERLANNLKDYYEHENPSKAWFNYWKDSVCIDIDIFHALDKVYNKIMAENDFYEHNTFIYKTIDKLKKLSNY